MSEIHNPWSIDPAIFQSLQAKSDATPSFSKKESKAPYQLVEGGKEDYEKVQSWYQIDAIPGYHVGRVEIIFNRTMTAGFEARVQMLEQRWENPAFSPKWSWDMEKEEIQKLRERAHTVLEHRTQKYQLAERHVHLIPLFHGTDKANFDSIFRTGFDNLATTDAGFFGKGIYNTSYAEYAYRVYCKNSGGQLICNWVAFYSAYPVAHGDIDKLMGKAKFQNYDAHYALVKPKDPIKKNESVYLPMEPGENPSYDELVVFESAQTLPRYVITLEADGVGLKVVVKKTTKSELLTAISVLLQKFKEKSDVKSALEKKMKSLQSSDPSKELNPQEFGLFRMIGILNEQTVLDDTILAELRMRLGLNVSSSRTTTGWSLLDKYKDANLENPKTYPSDPKEQFELGLHYFNGTGIKQDFGRSAFYFILAAKQGHEMATLLSGLHYEEGKGIRPNTEKAVGYYRQAAELGNVEAKYRLGNCYYEGKGVKQDFEMAVRLFREVAKEENPDAIKRLGDCYFNGYEVKKDEKKAVELYAQAAELGSAEAKFALANCLLEGKGTDKNGDQAVDLLKDLAYAGHAQGQHRLARCYAQGEGVNQDEEKAAKYFQLAADQGVLEAQVEAAVRFRQGKGVKPSEQEAAKYLKLAADQGNARAQGEFGVCCVKGVGVPPDPGLAFVYFQKSADQNDPEGFYHLGNCYETGQGVQKNVNKAIDYYQKAIGGKFEPARKPLTALLNEIAKTMNFEEAIETYQKAVDLGDSIARQALIDLLMQKGSTYSGTIDNIKKAIELYQRAANLGDRKAKEILGNLQYECAKKYLQAPTEQTLASAITLLTESLNNGNRYVEGLLGETHYELGLLIGKDPKRVRTAISFYFTAKEYGNQKARQLLITEEFNLIKLASENPSPDLIGLERFSFETLDFSKEPSSTIETKATLAKTGDARSLTYIGWYNYKQGKGKSLMDECYREAFKSFQFAAFTGFGGAIYGLGRCYWYGTGVGMNEKLGFELILLAANLGNPDAQWNLGNIYYKGSQTISKDGGKAHIYFRKAADVEPKLESALETHLQRQFNGKSNDKEMEKSVKELKKLADSKKNADAAYALGQIYNDVCNNIGTYNSEKAQKYFKIAASLGHEGAQRLLK